MDEFAKVTRAVIAKSGFDDYVPTACYPARREFICLVDLPPGIDLAIVLPARAAKLAENNEEYLVAFKVDDHHFKVIRRIGPYSEDDVFSII